MDTACVELRFSDGSMVAIDTIAVENEVADTLYQRSELDWLIYNKPLEYAQLGLEQDGKIVLLRPASYSANHVRSQSFRGGQLSRRILMSSIVILCGISCPSTISSKSLLLVSCNSRIFSSIVFAAINLYTVTFLFCPIL